MASVREQIMQEIVDTLKTNQVVSIPTVVREPTNIDNLARTAFPCVMLETSNEVREDITMMSSNKSKRQARLEIFMNVWVYGKDLDTKRNDFIEDLEKILDADRTRGALALDTELVRVEYREIGESAPYASMRLVWAIDYIYTTGTP